MMDLLWGRYFVGAPTPFDENGELAGQTLVRQAEYFLDNGCAGILVNGFTGEWFSMTREERRAALEVTVKTVDRQVPVVAFVGSTSVAETLALMKDAEKTGASAVAITPPAGVNHEPTGIVECYKVWASASNLPIMLYNLPSEIVNNLHTETVLQLAELPNIVAMKDVPVPLDQCYRTAVALNGKLRLFGSYMDRAGISLIKDHKLAHGYLGSGMLFGQWMSTFFDRLERGDTIAATELCDRFAQFTNRLFGKGFGHYWSVVKLLTDVQAGTRSYSRLPIRNIDDPSARKGVADLLDEFGVSRRRSDDS